MYEGLKRTLMNACFREGEAIGARSHSSTLTSAVQAAERALDAHVMGEQP